MRSVSAVVLLMTAAFSVSAADTSQLGVECLFSSGDASSLWRGRLHTANKVVSLFPVAGTDTSARHADAVIPDIQFCQGGYRDYAKGVMGELVCIGSPILAGLVFPDGVTAGKTMHVVSGNMTTTVCNLRNSSSIDLPD